MPPKNVLSKNIEPCRHIFILKGRGENEFLKNVLAKPKWKNGGKKRTLADKRIGRNDY